MPCRSDYMEPNAREAESKLVAKLLIYVLDSLNETHDDYNSIFNASVHFYGDQHRLDEWTAILCSKLKKLSKKQQDTIIYDGRLPKARLLADWWEKHQEADKLRNARERAKKKQASLRKSALAKLSPAERRALGF